jgi:hypothetical protein
VWMVEDGRRLFVDKNVNRGLTDDGPHSCPAMSGTSAPTVGILITCWTPSRRPMEPLKIAQPFMAGFTIWKCRKSLRDERSLPTAKFLPSLMGLEKLMGDFPGHEWLGYGQGCARFMPLILA